MTSVVEIKFTVDDPEVADRISEALLGERLVACSQETGPIDSRYWWEGKLDSSREWCVVLKTRAELSDIVTRRIVDLHPYDTPEILVVRIEAGNSAYLEWVARETRIPKNGLDV